MNKPNRIYVGNLEVRKITERVTDITDNKEVLFYDTNNTELNNTEFSNTKTNSFDEDEVNNNNNSKKSQQSFIAIGKIIQTNPELRSVVQSLIPDLLLNEPQQAEIVVRALNRGYRFLTTELEKGNSVLTLQKQVQGVGAIKQLLLNTGFKQVDYMRDHLIDISQYGKYFASGFDNRLKIAITTTQSVSGF